MRRLISPAGPHTIQLAGVLSALATRGEAPSEIAGFVDAMRAAATPVPLDEAEQMLLVDTCGTGADLSGTFNISTAAALVAAAAGPRIMVAKHGNRAVTSACGSADVLEALGIPIGLSPAEGAAALRSHRFAFLHAPALHPAMKAVMPVRRALGIRTIFHLVGPLSNPAGARAQVMGVYAARLVPVVAEAMRLLGVRHAFVVHGSARNARAWTRSPSPAPASSPGPRRRGRLLRTHAGASRPASAPIESLRGGGAAANAAILRAIFAGEPGPRRDVVLLNAAAVLIAAGAVPAATGDPLAPFRAAIKLAADAIDSGAVSALVAALAERTK